MSSLQSILTRPCDGKRCRACMHEISADDFGMRVPVPASRIARLAKSTIDKLLISWDLSKAVAFFHVACWENLYTGSDTSKLEIRILKSVEENIEKYQANAQIACIAKEVAESFRRSKRTVCFTGAGISVAAGIPTYRGALGIDTLAETNAGMDTKKQTGTNSCTSTKTEAVGASVKSAGERSLGQKHKQLAGQLDGQTDGQTDRKRGRIGRDVSEKENVHVSLPSEAKILGDDDDGREEEEFTDYTKLQPTLSHRSLSELHRHNLMHYCITQNCDDLHAKGGFPRSNLIELHGNVFCEYCEACGKQYFRRYEVDAYSTDCYNEKYFRKCSRCGWNHYTGRVCSNRKCRGKLRDTIVNFGDLLHEEVLGGLPQAEAVCEGACVCVCLGSSLTVSPANELPTRAKELVIVTPQATALDQAASHRLWATADTFFFYLLGELGIALP